jgi:hypothetical protein
MSIFDVIKSLEEKFSYKKEVTVSDINFELTILSYGQDQLISAFPEGSDDPLSFYEKTRLQILSYSIVRINGEIIPEIVEVKKGDKTETKEKAIYLREQLSKLPPKVLDKIFDVYIDFKDEVESNIDKNVEYQWYKTPEVREVERKTKDKLNKEKELKELADELNINTEKTPEDEPIVFTKIVEKDIDDKVTQE